MENENANIEEMPLSETEGDSLETVSEPMALSDAVVQSLADALTKIETYVPTVWVDNTEPDIDAEHLNHAEQAIMKVTALMNGAVDVIQDLQSQVTTLNSNLQSLFEDYSDAQTCMDAIYDWIMSAPQTVLLSKSIAASFFSNSISGELHSGSFQLIGYRRKNYAGIVAISYWSNKKMLVATIENGEWKTKFEKVVTTSDLANIPTFFNQNGLQRITFQLYKSGDISYLQAILNIDGVSKTLSLKEF